VAVDDGTTDHVRLFPDALWSVFLFPGAVAALEKGGGAGTLHALRGP